MRLDLMDKFILELSRTKDVEIFLGVARILKVKFLTEEKEPRDFNDVFNDILSNYRLEKKKRQKELLSILTDANKCKENLNGNSTKVTKETIPDKEM